MNPDNILYDILAMTAGEHHVHNRRPQPGTNGRSYPHYHKKENPTVSNFLKNPSFEAKILKLCDEYEGMTSKRPYQGEKGDNTTRNARTPAQALSALLKEANDWEINPVALHYFLEHKIYHALKSDVAPLNEADAVATEILEGRHRCLKFADKDMNISQTFLDHVKLAIPRLTTEEFYAIDSMREREAATPPLR